MIQIRSSELVLLITLLAIFIADGKTEDEINILGAVFTQLGDTLSTIAAFPSKSGQIKNSSA